MKKYIASAAVLVVLLPTIPFYLMVTKLDRMEWPHRLCDLADRIVDWSRR